MSKRLPKSQEILQVYAVIAVMLSGWTITAFLRKLPSWLLTLNIGEIFTVFSYAMVTNFIESLIVLLFLLLACILLPSHLFRDKFVVRGAVLSIAIIGSLMMFVGLHMQGASRLWLAFFEVSILMGVFLGFSPKFRFLSSAVLWISDRLVVFLFVLLPLYVILSAYVIFRNIA